MLKLIYAPDPILKKESVSIPQVDDHHRELIKQMYEVMYSANGVGLAAPQIKIQYHMRKDVYHSQNILQKLIVLKILR